MSDGWVVLVCLVAIAAAIKGAGPVLLGGRELPSPLARVLPFLPGAVLAALVVTQTFSRERELVLDARAAGIAAALAALLARAPVLLVLAVAAGVTAGARALA